MPVTTREEGSVRIITLDWPESRNALDAERLARVIEAITDADDGTAKCVVLTGNGAFCAGANLGSVEEGGAQDSDRRQAVEGIAQSIVRVLLDCQIPTIAAIDGAAVGMGMDIALACDHRFIGPEGFLLQGWGRLGLIPGTGGELLLRRLNPTVLWRLLADQPRLGPAEAESLRLGSPGEPTAIDAAIELATNLAGLPRTTLSVYVELFRAEVRAQLPAHLDLCARAQAELLADPELGTRIAALRERGGRSPS